MPNIETSIVIVNYNGKQLLRNCLRSLLASAVSDIEILVVDNASTDSSLEMVAREFPSVRLISSERNLGFAGGNNLGMRHSLGRYIVLLNSDAAVTRDWLRSLIEEAKSDPRIGVVGPKLLLHDGRINSTGLVFNHRLCNGGRPRSRTS